MMQACTTEGRFRLRSRHFGAGDKLTRFWLSCAEQFPFLSIIHAIIGHVPCIFERYIHNHLKQNI